MTPLGGVALGLALMLFDLRISGLDLIPDPLGWLLVVVFLGRLADPGFRRARGLAAAAALVSVLDLLGERSLGDNVFEELMWTVHDAVLTLALVLLALALRNRARAFGEDEHEARFSLFAVLLGALAATVIVLGWMASALDLSDQVPAVAVLLVLAVAEFAVVIWFVIALARRRRLPWLQAEAPAVPMPSDSGG